MWMETGVSYFLRTLCRTGVHILSRFPAQGIRRIAGWHSVQSPVPANWTVKRWLPIGFLTVPSALSDAGALPMWSGSPAGPALPDLWGGDFSSSVSFSHGRHSICFVLCTSMNRNCSSPRRNKDSSDTAEGLRMLGCVYAQRNLFATGLDQQEVFSRRFWAQANPEAEAAPFMAA